MEPGFSAHVLGMLDVGRMRILWRRGYLQLLWKCEWGYSHQSGGMDWLVMRPLLTVGK